MKRHLPLFVSVLLAGCASNPALRASQQEDLYRQYAGAPVNDFPYMGHMSSWTPLGRDALVVWTSPGRAYLLDVDNCSDLEFAQAIQLSDSIGRVSARFDRVTPLGTGSSGRSCMIREIRPVDVHAVREAEREARAPHN